MAAEVSSLFRIMNGYADDGEGKRRDLVTRDLLGGSVTTRSTKELDLDLRIPSGWERRLDLRSGEMYLKKSDPDQIIHDLNFPPPPPPKLELTSAVDLKLLLSSSSPSPSDYQCTLEKVKSALERAGRESRSKNQQRQRSDGSPSPSSSSTTSSSAAKRRMFDQEGEEVMDRSDSSGSNNLIAAGCSKCLMYVLISKGNPRCPRCDSHVPLPAIGKKPRIDLNAANLL